MDTQEAIRVDNIGGNLSIRIPMRMKMRGGRKEVIVPEGLRDYATPGRTVYQQALVVAMARAHRWKEMLNSGQYDSLTELAEEVGVHPSYAARLLRFTLLAPDIVEAILEGTEPSGFSVNKLARAVPEIWEEQREMWGFGSHLTAGVLDAPSTPLAKPHVKWDSTDSVSLQCPMSFQGHLQDGAS